MPMKTIILLFSFKASFETAVVASFNRGLATNGVVIIRFQLFSERFLVHTPLHLRSAPNLPQKPWQRLTSYSLLKRMLVLLCF